MSKGFPCFPGFPGKPTVKKTLDNLHPSLVFNAWRIVAGFEVHINKSITAFPPGSQHPSCLRVLTLLGQKERFTTHGPRSYWLVGGWTNPFEKYSSNWESSPNRVENKKYLKPQPSDYWILLKTTAFLGVMVGWSLWDSQRLGTMAISVSFNLLSPFWIRPAWKSSNRGILSVLPATLASGFGLLCWKLVFLLSPSTQGQFESWGHESSSFQVSEVSNVSPGKSGCLSSMILQDFVME